MQNLGLGTINERSLVKRLRRQPARRMRGGRCWPFFFPHGELQSRHGLGRDGLRWLLRLLLLAVASLHTFGHCGSLVGWLGVLAPLSPAQPAWSPAARSRSPERRPATRSAQASRP